MIRSYFLVAIRNFRRHKVFSAINILGLAIGISASLVIFLLVHHDLGFDQFEPQRDRIYRVVGEFTFMGSNKPMPLNCLPVPAAAAFGKEGPGIDLVVPFRTWGEAKVSIPWPNAGEPKLLRDQKDLLAADGRYAELLGYAWVAGSASGSLAQPYQAVLTEKNARRYFPNLSFEDILGKRLTIDDTIEVTVTGIVRDLPGNSDFYFGTIVSRSTLETARLKDNCWDNWGCVTTNNQLFVRLKPGTSVDALSSLLTKIYKAHQDAADDTKAQIELQPLSDLHFDTVYDGFDNGRTAHKPTLYGLMTVAAILLLLACVNFINLTTAQAAQRAREIGVRKAMGGGRRQLAFQFLSETLVLTWIATLLSIAFTPLLLHVFEDFIPADFHYHAFQPALAGFLMILVVTVSLLSGAYPALVLSGFNPVLALKNQTYGRTATTHTAWFRKTLTVSQFVIAQVFIIATILVGRQISYALNMDMGFRKDAIVYFRTGWRQPAALKKELVTEMRSIPGIDGMSVASDPPAMSGEWVNRLSFNDGHRDIKHGVQVKTGDSNYIRLFRLHLLAGSGLPQSDTTNAIVINASEAKALGFRDAHAALGRTVGFNHGHPVIVGVVADFHQRGVHDAIKPMVIVNGSEMARTIIVALPPGNSVAWPATIGRIEKAFHGVYPGDDFTYHFVDETVAKFYDSEQKTAHLLSWATGLTIFISCLGLLGLVIYVTNQRSKEIGIRKVIGASVMQIVLLLSRDFVRLIGLAILISLPIAWWGGRKWLENYVYRIRLSWWIFAAGGSVLLCFALAVLCFRTFRAAAANPVERLRSE